jgi:hypothetical protein
MKLQIFVTAIALTASTFFSVQSKAITSRIDQAETSVTIENPGLFNMQKGGSYHAEVDFKNNLIASSRVRIAFFNDRNEMVGEISFNLKGKRKLNLFSGKDQVTAAPSENMPGYFLYSRDLTSADLAITPGGNIYATSETVVGELTVQKDGVVVARVHYRSAQ